MFIIASPRLFYQVHTLLHKNCNPDVEFGPNSAWKGMLVGGLVGSFIGSLVGGGIESLVLGFCGWLCWELNEYPCTLRVLRREVVKLQYSFGRAS